MFQQSFPAYLLKNVDSVEDYILQQRAVCVIDVTERTQQYVLSGDVIYLPYRMYFQEMDDNVFEILNEVQKMILHCVYSRSYDGYVREKHIKALLAMDYQEWVIPFIVKVCDEYVVEILETVYIALSQKDVTPFHRFCAENSSTVRKSYARMISYWNVYYRHECYRFSNYIGCKLFMECFGYPQSIERT